MRERDSRVLYDTNDANFSPFQKHQHCLEVEVQDLFLRSTYYNQSEILEVGQVEQK